MVTAAIECDGGGYRVTGVFKAFASGGRHATWLGAHCPISQGRRLAVALDATTNGVYAGAHHAVRTEDVEWTDIWNTVGLQRHRQRPVRLG